MRTRPSRRLIKIWLVLGALLSTPAPAQSLTIQGKVLDGSNKPVSGSATQFRVQILSPDGQRCVLFDESHTIDLSQTGGLFSINLADGIGTLNAPNTYTLEQALSNRASFSVNSSYCASGSGTLTYTPGATDNRKVVIQFRDPATMSGFELIPEMDINPVAWAMESRTVGGFPASSLLRVVGGGVPGTAPALTPADVTELQALAAGSSTKYLSRDVAGGAKLPTYPGDPSSPSAGSMWFDATGSGAIKFKDASGTIQTLGSGGAGTITSVTGNNGLTASTTSGAVTVGMQAISPTSPAGDYGSASAVPVIRVDAYGRVTQAGSASITGTLPTGTAGEFLKYSAGAWGSAAVRMSDIKNATGAAALFGSTTCSASETFYWDSGTDQFKCQSIALGAPSSTVAATYTKVTVAADGRVNGGSATIGNSDIADLAWGKLTSVPNLVTNGGNASSLVANNTGSKPAGQVAGRIYVDVSNQKISYDNGTAWVDVSGSASAAPSASVAAPLTSTAGTIGIPQATGSVDGFLSSADWTSFTAKLGKALASAHLFVGNGAGQATDVAVSGDVSLSNAGAFTVNAIKGTAVSAVPSATGQVLRYDGTNYAPTLLSLADIRSNVSGSSTFTTTCTSGQTLTWNSGTDTLTCQNISVAAASQISGTLGVANGGTGAATTSQGFVFAGPSSGAGAPAFRALEAADLPSEAKLWAELSGNVYRGTGNVGIGTSSPAKRLSVLGAGQFIDANSNVAEIGDAGVPVGSKGIQIYYDNINDAGRIDALLQGTSGKTIIINPGGGNVGIGTTAPVEKFEVGSNTASSSSIVLSTTSQQGSLRLTSDASANWLQSGLDKSSDSKKDLRFSSMFGATTWMAIQGATGNVGIGTVSPTVSLDFNTRTDAIRLPAGTAAQQPGQASMPAAANGMIRYNTTSNSLEAYVNGAWANLATVGATQSFAGNVSVGGTLTSTGAATFNGGATIAGGALNMSSQNITGVGSITGSGALTVASGGTNTKLTLKSSGTGAVDVGTGNGTGLSIVDAGAATANFVTVKGAAAGSAPIIGTDGSDANVNLVLSPKGTGKIGIGTTSPTQKFSVVGGTDGWAAQFLGLSGGNQLLLGTLSGVATIGANNNAGSAWSTLSVNPGGNTTFATAAGAVGFGVASPTSQLHMNGTFKKEFINSADGSVTNYQLVANDGSGNFNEFLNSTGAASPTAISQGSAFRRVFNVGASGSGGGLTHQFATAVAAGAAQTWKTYLDVNPNNSVVSLVPAGGSVGIGTSAPIAAVEAQSSSATTSGAAYGSWLQLTTNPTSSSSAAFYGSVLRASSSGTQNHTGGIVGSTSQAYANSTAGTIAGLTGAGGAAYNTSGATVTSAVGSSGFVANTGAGTITNATGLSAGVSNTSNGTITNAYGIRVSPPSNGGGGTLSNNYGIYLDPQTGASTSNYSIYSAGGNNYFAGYTGIGTTNPLARLHVADGADMVLDDGTPYYIARSVAYPTAFTQTAGIAWVSQGAASSSTVWPYQAAMNFIPTENHSATNKGSAIYFSTTPNGSTTAQDRMVIGNDGNVGIGSAAPSAKLDVVGNIKADNLPQQVGGMYVIGTIPCNAGGTTFTAVTFSGKTGQKVTIRATSKGRLDNTGHHYLDLFLDGTLVDSGGTNAYTSWRSIASTNYIGTLTTTGTHTVQAKLTCGSGATTFSDLGGEWPKGGLTYDIMVGG